MAWIAAVIAGAALVVLLAVFASGLGPLSSLRGSLRRLEDQRADLDTLRRAVDRLNARRPPSPPSTKRRGRTM